MLEAGLLWYRKFRKDLERKGLILYKYDACVVNRELRNSQHTISFHVDHFLSSHSNPEKNDKFEEWAQQKYGAIKPVAVNCGKSTNFWA